MPISMYDASVLVFVRGLANLTRVLSIAEAHAAGTGLDPATLVEARLAEDMLSLAEQVQRASDRAKFATARLTGTVPPPFADDEATFEQLLDRCGRTIDLLSAIEVEAFEDSECRPVAFRNDGSEFTLRGDLYLLQYALPSFFFHVTTAYGILRQRGVPLGKRHYIGLYGAGSF